MAEQALTIEVPAHGTSYPIEIGQRLFTEGLKPFGSLDLKRYSKIVVLSDSNVARHWLDRVAAHLPNASTVVIPAGEQNKTIETVQTVWSEFHKLGIDRTALVVNVGGGVVGDLGGFAASCYVRGLDFVQVPTSLLSQVDASIGGKVGVDHLGVKNLLGAFAHPKAVIIDIETLRTLSPREFRSGFAEMIKHALISDTSYLEALLRLSVAWNDPALPDAVTQSCKIKAQIVSIDPLEKNERRLLNFGHTLGHAIESLSLQSDHPLTHGEAISIGMVGEACISAAQGELPIEGVIQVRAALQHFGLPIAIPAELRREVSEEEILHLIKYDKKAQRGLVRWTLLSEIGRGVVGKEISPKHVKTALQELFA